MLSRHELFVSLKFGLCWSLCWSVVRAKHWSFAEKYYWSSSSNTADASANLWDGKMLYTKSYYWTVGCFCLNVGSVALVGSYPIVWNAASSSVQRFLLLSVACRDCATMYQLSRNATAISLLLYGYGNYDRCHWYYFLKPNLLLYCWQRWPMTLRVAWQGLQVWDRYAGR